MNKKLSRARLASAEAKLRGKSVRAAVAGLSSPEQATLKGVAIAKIAERGRFHRRTEIEIVDTEPIDGGVQVFARAWRGGVQVGFGSDGKVDIERFRLFNPPILVPDENGDVVHEHQTYREDPQEALLQSLEHTISLMKNVHGPARIVPGRRGNTTSTFYPAAGANAPVDGRMGRTAPENFATLRSGAGTYSQPSGTSGSSPSLYATNNPDIFSALSRSIIGFPTAAIGADSILSAILSLYNPGGKSVGLGDTTIEVVSATPASEANLTNSDYAVGNYGTTPLASGRAISTLSTSAYNNYDLNTAGLAHIKKAGNTMFGLRLGWDVNNNFTGAWASGQFTGIDTVFADTAGTTQDPKLVVEHEEAGTSLSLDAETQTYDLTTGSIELLRHRVLRAAPASYLVTATNTALQRHRVLRTAPTPFELVTREANFSRALVLDALPASYHLMSVDIAIDLSQLTVTDPFCAMVNPFTPQAPFAERPPKNC